MPFGLITRSNLLPSLCLSVFAICANHSHHWTLNSHSVYSPFVLVTPNNWTQLWALLPRLRRRQVAGGVRHLKLLSLTKRIRPILLYRHWHLRSSGERRSLSTRSTVEIGDFFQTCRESLDVYLVNSIKKSFKSVFCHGVLEFTLNKRCWQGSPEKDSCMRLWQRQDAAPLYLQYYDNIIFTAGHFQSLRPAKGCTISQIVVRERSRAQEG